LAQKNIKNFKEGDITQYLIFEWIDAIGQVTLLVNEEIAPLEEPSYGIHVIKIGL
jgi:hypothetical protein